MQAYIDLDRLILHQCEITVNNGNYEVIEKNILFNSPLYDTVFRDHVETFAYLEEHYEPKQNLFQYILEKNAIKILHYILENPLLKTKVFKLCQEDKDRIVRLWQKRHKHTDAYRLFVQKPVYAEVFSWTI